MRTLYLIRHGQPAQPEGGRRCVSRTDLPLDAVGREQAAALRDWLAGRSITGIYTSPAVRCVETACMIAGGALPVYQRNGLQEVDVGQWEGLPFSEIKRRWPELYAARGAHIGSVAPPDGEAFTEAALRLDGAVSHILAESGGDVAVVSHGGALRAWLCCLQNMNPDALFSLPQPWGGVSTVRITELGRRVCGVGEKPAAVPGPVERDFLLDLCHTPPAVRQHCQAVAREALRLANASGQAADLELLECAALLHDLARAEGRDHPEKGAAVLRRAGYPLLAAVIAQHHDLAPDAPPEAELLYLADKLIQGTRSVPLEARFEASRAKCTTTEAIAVWERRRQTALALQNKYSEKRG